MTLDRAACDGIFACLVRDDRFVEREDGLAGIEGADDAECDRRTDGDTVTVAFDDDRRESAERAAAACPVDAIEVTATDGGEP